MRGCVLFVGLARACTLAPLRQGLLGRPGLFGKPCIGQALLVGPSAGVIRPAIAWLPRGGARALGRVPSNLAPVVFSAATKCRGLFGGSIVRKKCPCSKTARLRCPLGDRFARAKEPKDRTRAEPERVASRCAAAKSAVHSTVGAERSCATMVRSNRTRQKGQPFRPAVRQS